MKVQLVFDLSYLSEFSLTAPLGRDSYGMSETCELYCLVYCSNVQPISPNSI